MFIEDHWAYDLSYVSLSMITANSVAYLAGSVVKAMERSSRKCEECVGCLVDNQEDQLSSDISELIQLKNHGLMYPANPAMSFVRRLKKHISFLPSNMVTV